ncbi:MAG: adenine phosphoribosyltransferase, partial [Bacilli bacterium]|nr:adenine phosphoribosyltransferase [Bacilli bacterium]
MKIIKNMLNTKLNLRTQKDFPIEGVEFIDINPLILQGEVYSEIIDKMYDEIKDKKIDYIVSPEARGFIFGSIIANKLGVGIIPVRKQGKIPSNYVDKT